MIDIKANEIEALEIETGRLQKALQDLLEAPNAEQLAMRKELERANHHIQELMSLARQLYEMSEITKRHTDNLVVDFWSRPPSTI